MQPAAGRFLIASPTLEDPNFMRSVVILAEHGAEGSLGFIINRPLDMPLGDLWAECPACLADSALAGDGGPVERQKGLLVHTVLSLEGTAPLGLGLVVGGDLNALAACWSGGPDNHGPRLFLGHSGWAPGQLDKEIAEGAWLVRPGDPQLVVDAKGGGGATLWDRLVRAEQRRSEPSVN